jgi:hypothetical protein
MQHVEATSGASRTARESTGTLAAHGAGEERRGRRRHPGRNCNPYMKKDLQEKAVDETTNQKDQKRRRGGNPHA